VRSRSLRDSTPTVTVGDLVELREQIVSDVRKTIRRAVRHNGGVLTPEYCRRVTDSMLDGITGLASDEDEHEEGQASPRRRNPHRNNGNGEDEAPGSVSSGHETRRIGSSAVCSAVAER
jgi:hypothetical protein